MVRQASVSECHPLLSPGLQVWLRGLVGCLASAAGFVSRGTAACGGDFFHRMLW